MRPSENEQIRREYLRILAQRTDIGLARFIVRWVFAPSNIFDPHSRRKPKPEFLIILSYILLMAVVWAAVNPG